MKKYEFPYRLTPWLTALTLGILATGCGGGGGQAPILGGVTVAPIAPLVTTVTPQLNATGVPVNTKVITAAFTKAMDPATLTTASFTLACLGAPALTGTSVIPLPSGKLASLTLPAANLPPSTVCTATITSAAKDTFGIPLSENFTWRFTTGLNPDTTAPMVSGTINANGARNVATNTRIGATFSEALDPVTVNDSTFTVRQGNTVIPGTVSYSGLSAVFKPNALLASNTLYTATISNGAKDVAGNALANNYVWSWTTGAGSDTTAPTVTGTVNRNGATNIPTNTKVGVTFSEGMDPQTVTNANFTLKQGANLVPGVVSYSGVSAVFAPLNGLMPNTQYTVTIKSGANGVTDLADNPMQNDFVISWTTSAFADNTAPTVTGMINHTNVAIDTSVGVIFSEAMDPLTLNSNTFSLKQGSTTIPGTLSFSGNNLLFTPSTNLIPDTLYTMTVKGGANGVTDLADNPMAADYAVAWSTSPAPDNTAPTVAGTIHTNGQTNVATNTKVGATFSEGMNPLTVTNTNFSLTQGGAVVPGTISYSGINAVFTPTNALLPSTLYTVSVKGGAAGVADLANNRMVNDSTISWTTGTGADTTTPTVTLLNPTDLAQNVKANTTVNATFSEPMDPLTVTTASFTVAGVTGSVSYDAASRMATFTPSSILANGTQYTATISTQASDLTGNQVESNKVWTFTTAAPIVPPVVNPPVVNPPVVNPPVVTPASVDLQSAAAYGTFGGTAGMTNMGTLTQINGSIGTTATGSSSITGFHDTAGDIYTETGSNIGAVNGTIRTCTNSTTGPTSTGPNAPACALATQARLDAQTAYLALAAKAPVGGSPAPGAALAGITLLPGVYTAPGGSFLIQGGNLTLDAAGDPNATWVFQMAGTLTVGGPGAAFPQSIILAGGAQAKNVFWQVGSFATINAGGGGTMVGTIISQAGVAISTAGNVTPVTLQGRALSLGASVTLVNTVINVP